MTDIYGLGNAIVDTEYMVDDDFLKDLGVAKGLMTLVEPDRLEDLSRAVADLTAKKMSGGSAANTIYAARGFGNTAFYSCKVAQDTIGDHFLGDMREAGILINENARAEEGASGQCLILVTPDAERSMNTCLGVSSELSDAELSHARLRDAQYFYVEGYLSSNPASMAAAVAAREQAEAAHTKTALSLSDPAMVDFCRDELTQMLGNGVDVLFCNEQEALMWAGTDRIDIAATELADIGRVTAITIGARGCLVVSGHRHQEVGGFEVRALDTNGAGDIFAGAMLNALTNEASAEDAARFANFAAAHLVTQFGARLPSTNAYTQLKQSYSG